MVYRRHLFSLQAGSPVLSFTLQPFCLAHPFLTSSAAAYAKSY